MKECLVFKGYKDVFWENVVPPLKSDKEIERKESSELPDIVEMPKFWGKINFQSAHLQVFSPNFYKKDMTAILI